MTGLCATLGPYLTLVGSSWPRLCSLGSCDVVWEWPVHKPPVLPSSNPAFIVLHLLLQGLVYAEYTLEIFGYCQELEFSLPYLLLPYLLLGVNLLFFTLTCSANPGKSGVRLVTAQASCCCVTGDAVPRRRQKPPPPCLHCLSVLSVSYFIFGL